MFKNIKINNFRVLKNINIDLGRYITVLAGWNATGKSTLLALLANSTELKVGEGRTYSEKQFRAEFSEIIKGSLEYDHSEQDKLEIEIDIDDEMLVEKMTQYYINQFVFKISEISIESTCEQFLEKCVEICPNEYELCDILIDLCYKSRNNKEIVWFICGDVIIKNLLKNNNDKYLVIVRISC